MRDTCTMRMQTRVKFEHERARRKTGLTPLLLFVLLTFFSTLKAQDTIVNTGENWKFYQGPSLHLDDWVEHGSAVATWDEGITPFGFSYEDVATVVGHRNRGMSSEESMYFTKEFFLKDPFDNLAYEIRLRRDDGAIVYINGDEFWRSNVDEDHDQDGQVEAHNTVREDEEDESYIKIFPPEVFRKGINTISVALYQRDENTADCMFDLKLIEHNDVGAIPYLLRWMDEETAELEEKLREVSFQEQLHHKETQIELLTQSKRFSTTLTYTIIALFTILSLGAIFVVRFLYRLRREKELKIEDLKQQNRDNQRALLNNSLHNLKNNQYLESIKNSLELLVKENRNVPKELTNIIKNIERNVDEEEDWKNMEDQFNMVNSDFLNRLKSAYPGLSTTELRQCIFIRLLIPTKEIARLMNIEPRSVQTTRYRIKKKIGLSESEDLKDFLVSF